MRHPVIDYGAGSVPDVVEEGVTRFIVTDEIEAVATVKRANTLERRAIRKRFEKRFSVNRMVEDYVKIYKSLPRPR